MAGGRLFQDSNGAAYSMGIENSGDGDGDIHGSQSDDEEVYDGIIGFDQKLDLRKERLATLHIILYIYVT